MRISVLTRNHANCRFLTDRLPDGHMYQVIVEKGADGNLLGKRFKRTVRRKGRIKGTLDFLWFLCELPYLCYENARFERYIERRLKAHTFGLPVEHIRTVNSPELMRRLAEFSPDLIIVIGTAIIEAGIVARFRERGWPAVNWHAGLTPGYRGCKAELYCVINGEPEQTGSTLHLISERLDGGTAVSQEKLTLTPADYMPLDYRALRVRNVHLASDMLQKLIKHMEQKPLSPGESSAEKGQVYSTPRCIDYWRYYKQRKRLSQTAGKVRPHTHLPPL